MIESAVIQLNNGIDMPRIGLGTFRASGQNARNAATWALQNGIKLIDTASIYKNEDEIREALLSSRQEQQQSTFLTSKISPYEQGKKASAAFEDIVRRLGRLDLLLIHWPGASRVKPDSGENALLRHQTWQAMEDLYFAGRVRAIGVSNFTIAQLEALLQIARVCPAVNQVEVHPQYQQRDLLAFCRSRGIVVTAYGSLGSGSRCLLDSPEVLKLAQDAGRLPAQVLLRWALQKGCAVIPKSVHQERISTFAEKQLLTWSLSGDQMASLDAIPQGTKLCWDPEGIA